MTFSRLLHSFLGNKPFHHHSGTSDWRGRVHPNPAKTGFSFVHNTQQGLVNFLRKNKITFEIKSTFTLKENDVKTKHCFIVGSCIRLVKPVIYRELRHFTFYNGHNRNARMIFQLSKTFIKIHVHIVNMLWNPKRAT